MEYNSTIIHAPGVLVKCICRYWSIDLIHVYLGGLLFKDAPQRLAHFGDATREQRK